MSVIADDNTPTRLTPAIVRQIEAKIREVEWASYARITLVIKNGKLRFIETGISEPASRDED